MRLKMNKILIFFYISFSISFAQRPITSEDIVNLKTVSQASFHSDGSKIVYIKSRPSVRDGDKVSSFKEIWVTKSNGKDQKKYTSSSSSIRIFVLPLPFLLFRFAPIPSPICTFPFHTTHSNSDAFDTYAYRSLRDLLSLQWTCPHRSNHSLTLSVIKCCYLPLSSHVLCEDVSSAARVEV